MCCRGCEEATAFVAVSAGARVYDATLLGASIRGGGGLWRPCGVMVLPAARTLVHAVHKLHEGRTARWILTWAGRFRVPLPFGVRRTLRPRRV